MSLTSVAVEIVVLPASSLHRIRQSLQVLMGYATIYSGEPDLANVAQEWLQHVQRIAAELDNQTQNFLVSPPPEGARPN